VKGIAPFIAAPQSGGKGSRKAKAGKTGSLKTAGTLQKRTGVQGRTKFETVIREKLALLSGAPAERTAKGGAPKAGTKPSGTKTGIAAKAAAKPEEVCAETSSQDRAREKDRTGTAKPEAAAVLAAMGTVARPQSAPKAPASREDGQAPKQAEAVSSTPKQAVTRAGSSETPRITVTDLRKKASSDPRGQSGGDADIRQAALAAVRKDARTDAAGSTGADGDGSFKAALRNAALDPGTAGRESAVQESPAAARQVPVQNLRDILPGELVKTAGIVVRDGDAGEIRLVLKPESLGSVRIRMSLGDDGIEGRIIVDSQAVKEIFEGRLSDLAQALQQEGFQNATLSVSVGGGDADGRRREETASGSPPKRLENELERAVPAVGPVSMNGDYRVNLMA